MHRPSMPMFWGDYFADTKHLECAHHGAYLQLIGHYWNNDGLPDNDRELARITGLPLQSWRQMRPIIQAFFHDGWRHKRIDEEIAKYDERITRLKVSGSIGGTRAAMNRPKSAKRPPDRGRVAIAGDATAKLQQGMLQPGSSNHNHEDLTSSFFTTAARARETEKTPTKTSNEENQRQESVSTKPPSETGSLSTNTGAAATKKSGSAMKAFGVGSSAELATVMVAKGWTQ